MCAGIETSACAGKHLPWGTDAEGAFVFRILLGVELPISELPAEG